MKRRPERNLSSEQVHLIRISALSSAALGAQIGVAACTVRRARHGATYPDHPTPPRRLKVGGWKKSQQPALFAPEEFSQPGEDWRPVVGWERYYRVSSLGRVYSLHQTGRLCIGMPMEGGYRVVKLRDKARRGHVAIHVMVLEAFVGPRPSPAHEGCHNNGIGADSRLSNLRWDTATGNQADRVKHGTAPAETGCGIRKLSEEKVRAIRANPDVTLREWAEQFGCSKGAIINARMGRTWKDA